MSLIVLLWRLIGWIWCVDRTLHAQRAHSSLPVTSPSSLYILVCLPENLSMEDDARNHYRLTALKAKPVIDTAVHYVVDRYRILPANMLDIVYKDSALSDTLGPWRPFEALLHSRLDCILGYATNYELSPVARSSWLYKDGMGVPVITTVGLVDILDNKTTYKLLTRMNGSYRSMARFSIYFMKNMKWFTFIYLFQENILYGVQTGKHECFHQSVALQRYDTFLLKRVKITTALTVDPLNLHTDYPAVLKEASMKANSK